MRYFEKVIKSEFLKNRPSSDYDSIKLPKRATKLSAGYDFFVPYDIEIQAKTAKAIFTGVKAKCEDDEFLMIVVRSSAGIKLRLRLMNQVGIIDADYYGNENNDGHIVITLENTSDTDVKLMCGDRIAQGIFMKYLVATGEEEVKNKRIGGTGSTN